MDRTKVYMHGYVINIRVETGYQDINVISDSLGEDCYGLEELATKITPETIIDIGGHIGSFGLMAKKFWPNCKLIAVEPDTESYELYCMNLEDNGFDGTVLNKAISYSDRNVLLHGSRTTGGAVLLREDEAQEYLHSGYRKYGDITRNVDTITIEELTKDIDVIGLAKWDCEGAEIDAFRGMKMETAAKFKTMVGEYHLWGDGKRALQASPLDVEGFWADVIRKFPHLFWSWTKPVSEQENYGKFQAWPRTG